MSRVVAQCKICGKTLLPEEIEVGTSLVCPRCAPKQRKKEKTEGPARAAERNMSGK